MATKQELALIVDDLMITYPFITENQQNAVLSDSRYVSMSADDIFAELMDKIEEKIVVANSNKEERENLPLTDFIYYHKSERALHLHLTPKSLLPIMRSMVEQFGKEQSREKLNEYLEEKLLIGMAALVPLLEEDKTVNTISATSHLVEKFQPLFERTGFEIHKNSDEFLEQRFGDKSKSEREQFRYSATIGREKTIAIGNNYVNKSNKQSTSGM